MNRTSSTLRVLAAGAALGVTFVLFHSVASFARPTSIEQVAQAKKATVTVASVRQVLPQPR